LIVLDWRLELEHHLVLDDAVSQTIELIGTRFWLQNNAIITESEVEHGHNLVS
jgi:hypothetical protein